MDGGKLSEKQHLYKWIGIGLEESIEVPPCIAI